MGNPNAGHPFIVASSVSLIFSNERFVVLKYFSLSYQQPSGGGDTCTAVRPCENCGAGPHSAPRSYCEAGYWLGTTPAKQETWKFLGTAVSAATVAGVMIILNKTYGFTGEGALAFLCISKQFMDMGGL